MPGAQWRMARASHGAANAGHLVALIMRAYALATFHFILVGYAALGLCCPAAYASVEAQRPAFFFVAHPHAPRMLGLRPAGT